MRTFYEGTFYKTYIDECEWNTDEKQKCIWCESEELKLVKEFKREGINDNVCDGQDGTVFDYDEIHRTYQCQKCGKQTIFRQYFSGGGFCWEDRDVEYEELKRNSWLWKKLKRRSGK